MTLSSNWGFAIAELLNHGGLENNNGGIFASEDYCYSEVNTQQGSLGQSILTLDLATPPPELACSDHARSIASLAQSALSCVTATALSVHASAKAPAESLKPSAP